MAGARDGVGARSTARAIDRELVVARDQGTRVELCQARGGLLRKGGDRGLEGKVGGALRRAGEVREIERARGVEAVQHDEALVEHAVLQQHRTVVRELEQDRLRVEQRRTRGDVAQDALGREELHEIRRRHGRRGAARATEHAAVATIQGARRVVVELAREQTLLAGTLERSLVQEGRHLVDGTRPSPRAAQSLAARESDRRRRATAVEEIHIRRRRRDRIAAAIRQHRRLSRSHHRQHHHHRHRGNAHD